MGVFRFKQFEVDDAGCGMKIGTDSVLLGAWTDTGGVSTAIDLGAGSGLLALMIAQRCPMSRITAVEIDPRACMAAESNFSHSPWASRITAVRADSAEFSPADTVDLIITNPPYFTSELRSPDASRSTARHASGHLSPITAVDFAARHLSDQGSLSMITPSEYDDAVTYHAEMLRLKVWRKCLVSTIGSRPASRILWQICRDRSRKYQGACLSIRDNDSSQYSDDYVRLTQDFYLRAHPTKNVKREVADF